LDLKNGLLLSFSAPVMSAWALLNAAANAPMVSLCIILLLKLLLFFLLLLLPKILVVVFHCYPLAAVAVARLNKTR
jgi:hypothetical protein